MASLCSQSFRGKWLAAEQRGLVPRQVGELCAAHMGYGLELQAGCPHLVQAKLLASFCPTPL